jgi:mannose/fructose/N-acetylgalactosamine-specific phosphotransferase system component IID
MYKYIIYNIKYSPAELFLKNENYIYMLLPIIKKTYISSQTQIKY